MNKLINLLVALVLVIGSASPSWAGPSKLKNNLTITGNLSVGGTTTHVGAVANPGNVTVGGTLGVTGAQTNASDLSVGGNAAVTGNLAVTGTSAFTGAASFTVPITQANINRAGRRQIVYFQPGAIGGTLADSTTYRSLVAPGRIATVTGVFVVAQTPPAGGTNTVRVLKGSSAGNTMLSAASYDPTALVANTVTPMTLTATGADLTITAAQPIYVEWVSGVQTTDAINAVVGVEFEVADY